MNDFNYTIDKYNVVYRDGKRLARFKSHKDAEYAVIRYKINDEALKHIKVIVNGMEV